MNKRMVKSKKDNNSGTLTKNQQKILELLKELDLEITAQDLHLQLRQQKSKIGLATVYRTLKTLHLQGVIQERITQTGESLYQLIDHHTHHLNCINCGKSELIKEKHCIVDHHHHDRVAQDKFKLYYHTLEFYGLCETCQNL